MHILDDEQHGPPRRLLAQPVEQGFERLLLAALGRQRGFGESAVGGDREQDRQQREPLGVVEAEGFQVGFELVEPGPGGVGGPEPQNPLQAVRGRIQAAALVVGRASPLQDRGRPSGLVIGHEFLEDQDQPRLADARLAGQQDKLCGFFLGVVPSVLQEPTSWSRPVSGESPADLETSIRLAAMPGR